MVGSPFFGEFFSLSTDWEHLAPDGHMARAASAADCEWDHQAPCWTLNLNDDQTKSHSESQKMSDHWFVKLIQVYNNVYLKLFSTSMPKVVCLALLLQNTPFFHSLRFRSNLSPALPQGYRSPPALQRLSNSQHLHAWRWTRGTWHPLPQKKGVRGTWWWKPHAL